MEEDKPLVELFKNKMKLSMPVGAVAAAGTLIIASTGPSRINQSRVWFTPQGGGCGGYGRLGIAVPARTKEADKRGKDAMSAHAELRY